MKLKIQLNNNLRDAQAANKLSQDFFLKKKRGEMHDSLVQHVAPSNLCLWTGDSVGSGGISVWWPNFILIISFSYTTKKNKSKTNFWCDIGSVRRSALPTRAIPLRASRSPVRSLSASSITHGAPSFLRSFLPSALSSPRRQSRTRAPSTARPFL